MGLLDNINGISNLKELNIKQLPELCGELREFLVPVVLKNGGHLASNLGAVELTVALHYVFDECDKIVWDVGHQAYIHKILTGRKGAFGTLRQRGGLSGFPDPTECAADIFCTGHASTAVSVVGALAAARDLSGEEHNVIAVVGDGALTGGLSFEGLNNIQKRKMLIVFNDNDMSINKNVGSARSHMSRVSVGKYDKNKRKIKSFLAKMPLVGRPLSKFLHSA